jgi:CHASE2 domain-containing sensor protein
MSRPSPPHVRSLVVGLLIGLLSAAIATLAGRSELASRTENTTYDLRVRQTAVPVDPSSPVVIVEINELSAAPSRFGRWPGPGSCTARDRAPGAAARVVVYDVIFAERGRGQFVIADHPRRRLGLALVRRFARQAASCSPLKPFEGAVDATVAGVKAAPVLPGIVYRPGAGFEERPDLRLPLDALARVARGVGHTYLARESDDSARRQLPFISYQDLAVPSIGVAAVLAAERVGEDQVRTDGDVCSQTRTLLMLAVPVPSRSAAVHRGRRGGVDPVARPSRRTGCGPRS